MAISFKKLTPNLMVESVDETITFYKDVLGFEVVTTVPDAAPFDFAILKRGDVEVMFQSRASITKDIPGFEGLQVGGAFDLYIDLTGIQDLYEAIKDKVTIIKDIHTSFYGTREFYIKDCNGYMLGFAEDVSNA